MTASISLRIKLCLNFARLLQGRGENAVIQNSIKMNAFRRQVQALASEIIDENASFRTFDSDEVGYISSQPRYDHFDISAY